MSKRITAAELMARLKADPAYVEARAEEDAARGQRQAGLRQAETPLVEALRGVGLAVESVWDLVNTPARYPEAIPVLLEHLERNYPAPIREGIARALAVPDARSGWSVLIRSYQQETEPRVRGGLAAAIAAVAEDDLIEEVIALARDPRHGTSRVLLLSALEKLPRPRAISALGDLAADPQLAREVRAIRRRLRA